MVVAAAAADACIGEQVLAIDDLGAFRAFAPETISLLGFLCDLDHGLTLAAISEPVEKRHGDDPDQSIKRPTGLRAMIFSSMRCAEGVSDQLSIRLKRLRSI